MRTIAKQLGLCILMLGLIVGSLHAQDNQEYFTVSGVVQDKQDNSKLDNVIVSAVGTNVSTVTNTDGFFLLKIKAASRTTALTISRIGYHAAKVSIAGKDMLNQTFYLTANLSDLKGAYITTWEDPSLLVKAALGKIKTNYSGISSLMTGFYRETVKKRQSYINVAEAVINIDKTAYKERWDNDRVEVYKGRKVLSSKSRDTLSVKLQGGPILCLYADFVKNPEVLFDEESISNYTFKMDKRVFMDGKAAFVVNFEPLAVLPYPLFYGKVYIDEASLSFIRVEFSLDMRDRSKAIATILQRKPQGLRFSPEELNFVVNYRQQGDKTYLSYIRNEIKFKCDWKKRLFSTNYTVVSEVAITDRQDGVAAAISKKNSFDPKEVLSDKIMAFSDDNFWADYNIIEPTESLESAIAKLKKQYK